jgi:intein/homing endonuclease
MYVCTYVCVLRCMCLWADATDHLPPIQWLKLGVGLYPTVRNQRRQLRGRKGREVVSVSPLFPWRSLSTLWSKREGKKEGRKAGRKKTKKKKRRRRRRRRGRSYCRKRKKDSVSSRWQSRRVDRLERSCTAAEAKVVAKSLLLLLLLIHFSSSLVPTNSHNK